MVYTVMTMPKARGPSPATTRRSPRPTSKQLHRRARSPAPGAVSHGTQGRQPSPSPATGAQYRTLRLTQLVVLVDYTAVGFMRTVLPYYAKALGARGKHVGGLETVYGLGQVVGAVLLGWLSDAKGRKSVLLVSFLGAALGYAVASAAVVNSSVVLLLASRLPVGLAKQTVTATRAIISDVTSPDAGRSVALARLFAGCSLGYAVGPYLGGRFTEAVGTTSPLPAVLCAATFVALMPLVAIVLPETGGCASETAREEQPHKVRKGVRPVQASSRTLSSREQWLLLVGCTLPEGALVVFASTSLPLIGHALGWAPSQMGQYNSAWGLASGVLSLSLWPWLFASGRLPDRAALNLGTACLAVSCSLIACRPTSAVLWLSLPLGVVAVGMIRSIPASLLTKYAPASARGAVLGRLDAAGSLCRVLLPTLVGALSDALGLWAAFAAPAGMCLLGLVVLHIATGSLATTAVLRTVQ